MTQHRMRLLQKIAEDPASTPDERAAAQRELEAPTTNPPTADQAAIDCALEQFLTRSGNDGDEIHGRPRDLLLDLVGPILGFWPDYDFITAAGRMAELYQATGSSLIRERAARSLRAIAERSPEARAICEEILAKIARPA